MRIVFYGTPEFAVASLQKIIDQGFNVVAVVTAPDRPAGRGMHLHQSDVKTFALAHNLRVLQPTNLKSPQFMEELKSLKPDLQIIIAFRMLPEPVWSLPPLGTLNLHASLLPNYRGAAPINWAIINGETITGVTTFFLKHLIDTGNILMQQEVEILKDDDVGILHDNLMNVGSDLVIKSLKKIEASHYVTTPQVVLTEHKHAPKIFTPHCEINWNQALLKIHNLIRGLSPYPGAFTHYQTKILKIYKGYYQQDYGLIPGTVLINSPEPFKIAGLDGWYCPTLVQPEGKRKMPIEDFVNGLK